MKNKRPATQKELILSHLIEGKKITPAIAILLFNCWRLADVIYKLKKDGHEILTDIPKGHVHAEYRIVR